MSTAVITAQEIWFNEVYYDSVNGEAGTAWPIGTAAHPVNNHDDLMTILAANPRINRIHICGGITLVSGDTFDQHTVFEGDTFFFSTIYIPAGVTVTTLIFKNLYIDLTTADSVTTASFEDCTVGWGPIGTAALRNCYIEEPEVGINGTWSNIVCDDWDLDLTNLTGTLNIFGFKGKVQLTNLTAGIVNIFLEAGSEVTIAASCTGGVLNLFGSGNITDNSAGTAVTDNTLETTKT